jgi:hypothetical protein
MPFVDDPNDNQENTGVAGAAPLSQGTPSQPMQDSENMSQQAASGPAAGSEAPAQQAATNKSAKKASSGMFNNIQKYVNKNRPQAQKMAGAVTSDVSKQAGEIRQAAEAKQAQQNQAIQANQNVMDQNRTFAQGQVDNIMNPTQQAPTTQASPEDNQQKFQDLMSGKVQGYNKAQDLNLAQQQNKSAALKSLAQGANTEQGRRNLLGETFQKQGAYTRGQSGLDQLITSGDQAARESLIQGTQATAKGLSDDLGNISQIAAGNLAAQQEQKNQFGEDITNIATSQLGQFDSLGSDIENLRAEDKLIQGLDYSNADKQSLAAGMSDLNKNQDAMDALIKARQQEIARKDADRAKNWHVDGTTKTMRRIGDIQSQERYDEQLADLQQKIASGTASNEELQAAMDSGLSGETSQRSRAMRDSLTQTGEQADKYAALQSLIGGESAFNIQDLIDQYSELDPTNQVKSGGTVRRG